MYSSRSRLDAMAPSAENISDSLNSSRPQPKGCGMRWDDPSQPTAFRLRAYNCKSQLHALETCDGIPARRLTASRHRRSAWPTAREVADRTALPAFVDAARADPA